MKLKTLKQGDVLELIYGNKTDNPETIICIVIKEYEDNEVTFTDIKNISKPESNLDLSWEGGIETVKIKKVLYNTEVNPFAAELQEKFPEYFL